MATGQYFTYYFMKQRETVMANGGKLTVAELMKDHYDNHLKSANYLFAAHGAGLVGCLSILKDYASTPQLKGIGMFIVLFGVGLVGAILNYIALSFARIVVMNAIMDREGPDKSTATFLTWLHIPALL